MAPPLCTEERHTIVQRLIHLLNVHSVICYIITDLFTTQTTAHVINLYTYTYK